MMVVGALCIAAIVRVISLCFKLHRSMRVNLGQEPNPVDPGVPVYMLVYDPPSKGNGIHVLPQDCAQMIPFGGDPHPAELAPKPQEMMIGREGRPCVWGAGMLSDSGASVPDAVASSSPNPPRGGTAPKTKL